MEIFKRYRNWLIWRGRDAEGRIGYGITCPLNDRIYPPLGVEYYSIKSAKESINYMIREMKND